METIQPTAKPTPDQPISERTRAILEMHKELQDVSAAVQDIRKMMRKNESWRSAAWRAIMQFIGDLKNGA